MENLQFCTLCKTEPIKTCSVNIKSKNSKNFGNKCSNKAKYELYGYGYCGVHKNYLNNHYKLDQDLSLLLNNMTLSNKRKNKFKNSNRSKKTKKITHSFGFKAATLFPKEKIKTEEKDIFKFFNNFQKLKLV